MDLTELIFAGLLALVGGVTVWLIVELVSGIVTRKYINDLSYAYINNLQNAINTILQTGAVERAEFLRQTQIEMQLTWQTVRTAIAIDMVKDLVRAIEEVPSK
ncbi:MAG: hypothetical protein QXK01_08910 [Thermofilum sp.]|uniref:hypothetical protein n=1 Tax=Thermofilum sp. TaxID=1961369 RepID=UPI00316046E1